MSFSPASISAQHAKGPQESRSGSSERGCARARARNREGANEGTFEEGRSTPVANQGLARNKESANNSSNRGNSSNANKHTTHYEQHRRALKLEVWARRGGVVCFVIQATAGMLPCGFCPRVLGRCLVWAGALPSMSSILFFLLFSIPSWPSSSSATCNLYPSDIYLVPSASTLPAGCPGTSGRERCNDTLGPFIKHARELSEGCQHSKKNS